MSANVQARFLLNYRAHVAHLVFQVEGRGTWTNEQCNVDSIEEFDIEDHYDRGVFHDCGHCTPSQLVFIPSGLMSGPGPPET